MARLEPRITGIMPAHNNRQFRSAPCIMPGAVRVREWCRKVDFTLLLFSSSPKSNHLWSQTRHTSCAIIQGGKQKVDMSCMYYVLLYYCTTYSSSTPSLRNSVVGCCRVLSCTPFWAWGVAIETVGGVYVGGGGLFGCNTAAAVLLLLLCPVLKNT